MRRVLALLCIASSVGLLGIPAASAARTSVNGTGSYEKLVVINGTKNLVFKISAPGGECDIKYLQVDFRDRDGTRYSVEAGCYPGSTWAANLVRGENIVACDGFSLRFNEDTSVWTATIPRTCLKRLGAAVKVTYSSVDDYSPNVNEVSGTPYVAQG